MVVKMKKVLIGLLLLLLLVVAGYIYAKPYMALREIQQGIRDRDAAALSQHIDFAALQQNLKQQAEAAIATADVIVTDGFTGNVVLKVAEGLGEMVVGMLKEEARQSPLYGAGLVLAKGAFRNVKRKVDYSEHGGAPLLGVNGACLIGHGRSTAKAIRNAIRFADSYAESDVIEQIGDKIIEVLSDPGESPDG